MKKAILIIISVLAIVATAFALIACDNSVKNSKTLKAAAFAAVGATESDVARLTKKTIKNNNI